MSVADDLALSKGLFRRAIGESGAVILAGDPLTLVQAEQRGEAQAARWKLPADPSLKDLRAISAIDILNAEPNYLQTPAPNLGITVDGYVFQRPRRRSSRRARSTGSRCC